MKNILFSRTNSYCIKDVFIPRTAIQSRFHTCPHVICNPKYGGLGTKFEAKEIFEFQYNT